MVWGGSNGVPNGAVNGGSNDARPPKMKHVEVERPMERVENGDTVHWVTMPLFPSGDFAVWVAQHMSYPEKAQELGIEGTVLVQFMVECDGKVGNVEVLESPNGMLNVAAVGVVRRSPRWVPGEVIDELKDGTVLEPLHPVRVRMKVPVRFVLLRDAY